jgi:hypothetical protein
MIGSRDRSFSRGLTRLTAENVNIQPCVLVEPADRRENPYACSIRCNCLGYPMIVMQLEISVNEIIHAMEYVILGKVLMNLVNLVKLNEMLRNVFLKVTR